MFAVLAYVPLPLFLLSMFAGGLISSFAGFGFAPVAGAILVFFLPYKLLIPLLMASSIVVQVITLWQLRQKFAWRSVLPMISGGMLGLLAAMILFRTSDPAVFKRMFGIFLVAYAACMFFRRVRSAAIPSGTILVQGGVGLAGGLVAGITAMPGAVPTIYSDLQGHTKETQRATVQPFILFMQSVGFSLFMLAGEVGPELMYSFAIGVPALMFGLATGMFVFRRVPDAIFRRVILVVLGTTGAVLVA
jgi:uncharacterized protein